MNLFDMIPFKIGQHFGGGIPAGDLCPMSRQIHGRQFLRSPASQPQFDRSLVVIADQCDILNELAQKSFAILTGGCFA